MTIAISPKIFNTAKTDYKNTSLFLGEEPGLFDTVNKQYPKIWKLYKAMKSLDWDEVEFDYSSCNAEFKSVPQSKSQKMIKSLAWQWEADSVASRAIAAIVVLFNPCSELWAAWQRVSDNECHVDGTEVLTPTGWVDLSQVTTDTVLAQYHPADKRISFVNPSRAIEKDYEGQVFEFRSHYGHFVQCVTPGHRMPMRNRKTHDFLVKEATVADYQAGSANNLISAEVAGWVEGSITQLTPMERILLAIQADGSVSDRYDGSIVGTVPVQFGFSKARKINRLIDLCNLADIELIELTPDIRGGNVLDQRRFKINVPVKYKPYLKNFSWVDLTDKHVSWCKDFLDETIQWDGHFTKNTGILHTTSKEGAEITQLVATLAGMKTHLGYHEDTRKETFSPTWRCTWKNQSFVSGQGINKFTHDYSGKVRCVTVDTGFFMVRYKGAVSVSGNCVHAATYSEIVRSSFDNPREVLDNILGITEALQRLGTVGRELSKVRERGLRFALGLVENDQETYNAMFMFTFVMLCLERIQFMASFAVTFALGEENLFMPICKAVQKIAQDEYEVHVDLDREVLAHELTTERGQIAYQQLRPTMNIILNEVIASEIAFVPFVFAEGEDLDVLNQQKLCDWIRFSGTNVARPLRLDMDEPQVENNPLHYMKSWLDISDTQPSPQEESVGMYKVNLMRRDDEDFDFEDL